MIVFFKLLLGYVDSLKWVLLIAVSIYSFKEQIKKILDRTVVVKYKDSAIELVAQEESNQEDAEKIKEIATKANSHDVVETGKVEDKDGQILQLTIEKHFEYTYRLIFRSQILLLQSLQTFPDGFSIAQTAKHFESTKKYFDIFSSWNIDIYLKFLYDQRLIERDTITGKIKLSKLGNMFLQYLALNQYDYNVEKNL